METERHQCPKCGAPSGDRPPSRVARGDRRCRSCYNATAREWARLHPRFGSRTPYTYNSEAEAHRHQKMVADPLAHAKLLARRAARRAIRVGKLIRQPCEVCGATATEAHHDDYSRRLEVRWLCRPHHREHHEAERAQRPAA